MLLCVSGGAVEGTDGGKSTSRDLPPAAFGETGRRGRCGPVPQKGIPKGLVPWAGAGRARRSPRGMVAKTRRPREERAVFAAREAPIASVPPCSGRVCQPLKNAREYAKRFFPASRRACQPFLKGKSPHKQHFSANQPKPGAPHSSAFAPPGQTASPPHPAAPLAPLGQGSVAPRAAVPAHHHSSASAASARPALPFTSPPRPPKTAVGGRPLLVGLPPSAPSTAPPETQRSAHAPCSWGIGASIPSRRRWPPALPALLVGLPPSAPSPAPPETQRSAHAPCSWGMGASIPSQRRWPPALPARRRRRRLFRRQGRRRSFAGTPQSPSHPRGRA